VNRLPCASFRSERTSEVICPRCCMHWIRLLACKSSLLPKYVHLY
jgi:hypothetical protein